MAQKQREQKWSNRRVRHARDGREGVVVEVLAIFGWLKVEWADGSRKIERESNLTLTQDDRP